MVWQFFGFQTYYFIYLLRPIVYSKNINYRRTYYNTFSIHNIIIHRLAYFFVSHESINQLISWLTLYQCRVRASYVVPCVEISSMQVNHSIIDHAICILYHLHSFMHVSGFMIHTPSLGVYSAHF